MTLPEELQQIADNFIGLLKASLSEAEDIEKQKRLLIEQEKRNHAFSKELDERDRQQYAEREKLKAEREYVHSLNEDVTRRELKLKDEHDYHEEIRLAKEEFEEAKAEAIRQQRITADKMKELASLSEKEKSLDERESVINKKELIDIERKRLLDKREERIRATEARLHIEQNE